MRKTISRPGETRRRLAAAEARAQALNDALVAVATAWPASAADGTTGYSDPVIARRQARRQRIAASGLTVVR